MLEFVKKGEVKNGNYYDLYRCECGVEKLINKYRVKSGETKSCGCLKGKLVGNASRKHGMSKSGEHQSWSDMKIRCSNFHHKSFHNYGGRGITVCERWVNSFENFIEDMGLRPTNKHQIDRIDNNMGYSPENCRWATCAENRRNTRSNVITTWQGRTMCRVDWAKELGIKPDTVQTRVNKLYWSELEALGLIPRSKI